MQKHLQNLISNALHTLQGEGIIPGDITLDITITRARDKQHGDFASNIAMILARTAGMPPRELATKIISRIPAHPLVAEIEIAGPGFINFRLDPKSRYQVVEQILNLKDAFGRNKTGQGKKVLIEFVSANPTGPLHVGHGRGAAYGATVAELMKACGYDVTREYYVNDAGRQMAILACSVWLRYLEACGETIAFPVNGYKGDYIRDIASSLKREVGTDFLFEAPAVFRDIPADEVAPGQGDKELHIDALIERCRTLLGEENYSRVAERALESILADIRDDLGEFGVHYEQWYREQSLVNTGKVDEVVSRLREKGQLYQKEGAWWFRSSDFGDEKDRVVIRENGQMTYFATDIAYHAEKFDRGFDSILDVWGADHHGYVPRIRAALQALELEPDRLEVLLVQFAILYRQGEKAQMSTRSGEFVTLRELRREVGNDAARFFYVQRKCEQHMDFDLDLAVSRSNENPVYYVQYAHARICSVLLQLKDRGLQWHPSTEATDLDCLCEPQEYSLLDTLARYPDVIESAGHQREPHQLAYYLRDLATDLHGYYNAHQFLVENTDLRQARLSLIYATRQVLRNGLAILGVSAPDTM